MNDNKSRDIFYGVVAVATLIVALVGATLAYFSISAGSKEGAVSAKAAVVSVNYSDGMDVITQAKKLIPSSDDIMRYFYEKNKDDFGGEGYKPSSAEALAENPNLDDDKNPCTDKNGHQVCSVYRFSVSTNAGDNQQVKAYLYTENNTFRTNYLAYAVRDVNCTYNDVLGTGDFASFSTIGQFFTDIESNYTSGTSIRGPYDKCWLNLGPDEDDAPVKYDYIKSCSDGVDNKYELGLCFTTENTIKTYNSDGNNKSINSVFGVASNNDKTVTLLPNVTSTYDLVIFLDDSHQNQDIDQGAEFKGTLKVEVVDPNSDGRITGRVNNNG